jgi:hypothetical protein
VALRRTASKIATTENIFSFILTPPSLLLANIESQFLAGPKS